MVGHTPTALAQHLRAIDWGVGVVALPGIADLPELQERKGTQLRLRVFRLDPLSPTPPLCARSTLEELFSERSYLGVFGMGAVSMTSVKSHSVSWVAFQAASSASLAS